MEFSRRALIIGGFEIYWYGLIIALGVLAGCLLAMRREKRLGLPGDTALDLVLIGAPVALLCARLYYVAFSWDYYAAHPAEILSFRDGGMAIYGGVLGGLLAGWLYQKRKKLSYLKLADLAAPSFALGQCIGRWGNFLNQEAYGRAVTNPALQFFPVSVFIEGSGWHYATFFYESLWCALIVAALLLGERRRFFRRTGDLFFAYVFLYALERAVVEGLRTDSLYLGPLRVSQLLSLCALLAVALLLALRSRRMGLRRFLPLFTGAGMALAAAMDSTLFTVLAGLATLLCAAVIYHKGSIPDEA